jgi:hypothetical protein
MTGLFDGINIKSTAARGLRPTLRMQPGIIFHVGMLPSRGDVGIFIWVMVGLSVIVFRLVERPK